MKSFPSAAVMALLSNASASQVDASLQELQQAQALAQAAISTTPVDETTLSNADLAQAKCPETASIIELDK